MKKVIEGWTCEPIGNMEIESGTLGWSETYGLNIGNEGFCGDETRSRCEKSEGCQQIFGVLSRCRRVTITVEEE